MSTAKKRPLGLRVSQARTQPILDDPVVLPAWAAAVSAGVAAALVGLVVVAAVVLVAWWGVADVGLPEALRLAGRLWLAAHGARVTLGPVLVGLTPLGISLGVAVVTALLGGWAMQQTLRALPVGPDAARLRRRWCCRGCRRPPVARSTFATGRRFRCGWPPP